MKKLEKSSAERREGAIAIRIRKLCNEINEQRQLDQKQRIVVVIQALEFCKSGSSEVSPLEQGFISTLAEGLNITKEEYEYIEISTNSIISIENLLLINGNQECS